MRRSFLSAAALLAGTMFLFASYDARAAEAGIQMLPPQDFSGNPCVPSTGGLLQWDGASSIKCIPGVMGNGNGNIGVGTSAPNSKLDVYGEIQVHNSNAACTDANKGAFRFKPKTASFEGCNGVTWRPLQGEFKKVPVGRLKDNHPECTVHNMLEVNNGMAWALMACTSACDRICIEDGYSSGSIVEYNTTWGSCGCVP